MSETRRHKGGWLLGKHALTSLLRLLEQPVVKAPSVACLALDRQPNVGISIYVSQDQRLEESGDEYTKGRALELH